MVVVVPPGARIYNIYYSYYIYIISIVIIKSSGLQILSRKYHFIVSHIVWGGFMTPETTISVVVCNLLCPDVNVKTDVIIKREAMKLPSITKYLITPPAIKNIGFARLSVVLDCLTSYV